MRAVCNDTGKIIFPNEAEARSAVASMRWAMKLKTRDGRRIKHRRRKVGQKRVYYCSFCEGYHLTKWSWWLYGSKKRTSLKHRRYENEFII